jgi:hypothetical protein
VISIRFSSHDRPSHKTSHNIVVDSGISISSVRYLAAFLVFSICVFIVLFCLLVLFRDGPVGRTGWCRMVTLASTLCKAGIRCRGM